METTTWHPNPAALETLSVPELVAFFMCASENMTLCDDGHEPTVERAGRCVHQ